MPAPIQFQSTDTGAVTLSGTAGDLISVLSSCLVFNTAYTTADDISFTDRTTEGRLRGGTTFNLLPTPASGDRFYIGLQRPFSQMRFVLDTPGVGGAYVFEYWNGSAWTALTVTDGTSGFTASGLVTWTIPGSWATKSVNSVTLYYVRVRATSNPGTVPGINCCSITDWNIEFTSTNGAVYRANTGARQYLNVNDNGPGAAGAQEARVLGYESMSAFGTGTNLFPTAAQATNGLFVRKSAAASGTTRAWALDADHRTFYMGVLTADISSCYFTWGFGEYYFTGTASATFNSFLQARATENSATGTVGDLDSARTNTLIGSSETGFYVCRAGTMTGPSVTAGRGGDGSFTTFNNNYSIGLLTSTNTADGGFYTAYMKVCASSSILGRMRGYQHFCHALGVVNDKDVWQGVGTYAGKAYRAHKGGPGNGSSLVSVMALETTAWDTN